MGELDEMWFQYKKLSMVGGMGAGSKTNDVRHVLK